MMNKSFGNSCNCPVFSHPGCGPDSTYTRIKPCQKSFDFLLLDYSLEFFIQLQRETSIDKGDWKTCINPFTKLNAPYGYACTLRVIYLRIHCKMIVSYTITAE